MSHAKKNSVNMLGLIVGLVVMTGIAVWQFYEYATYQVNGVVTEGGSVHLVAAIAMTILACLIGFLIFSVFLRHDTDDELHITFAPTPQPISKANLK